MENDPLVEQMAMDGVPLTRANYIKRNWSPLPDPWLPEHEAALPEQLQDWSLFPDPRYPQQA
ncbi:MAG TPA: hypothetical protein VF748_04990 [Candidatus Acidoferrum sp.]